jgi:hypothetical protein
MDLLSYYPNATISQVNPYLTKFWNAVRAVGATITTTQYRERVINDAFTTADDPSGFMVAIGSRLIPDSVYRKNISAIGTMYEELLVGDGTNQV